MMEKGASSSVLLARMQPLVELQRRRLKFAELGSALWNNSRPGSTAAAVCGVGRCPGRLPRVTGDPDGEMRAFAAMPFGSGGREQQMRLFQLLLTRQPNELVRRASYWTSVGQDAADYVVANGSPGLVHSLVCCVAGPVPLSGRSHTTPSSGFIFRNEHLQ